MRMNGDIEENCWGVGSCQPVLHANILFSVIHFSREQHLISYLLSQLKCGHALSQPLITLPNEVLPD